MRLTQIAVGIFISHKINKRFIYHKEAGRSISNLYKIRKIPGVQQQAVGIIRIPYVYQRILLDIIFYFFHESFEGCSRFTHEAQDFCPGCFCRQPVLAE